ncbi:MAG: hypothetical protein R6V83_08710 [Candidatus Thorarchaeota archaeon]
MALSSLSGGVYTAVGVLILLSTVGIVPFAVGSGDILTGLMILVVGAVFLEGVKNLRDTVSEAAPFLIVGILLSSIVAGLQVAILLSNALGWIIGLEEWTEWNIASDLTPAIWLFPVAIPLLVAMHPFSKHVVRKPEEVT